MKKVKWIVISIIFVILILTVAILSTFRISTIKYEGNERVSNEEMDERIFVNEYDKNPFVFYFNTKYSEQPTIPFVDRYDVEIDSIDSITITVYEKDMIGYVMYMGSYLYFDKDGMVVESSDVTQDDIPLVSGISFEYFVLNEKLPVENENVFDEILGITQQLNKYKLDVDKINISSDMEISLYMDKVIVELGKDDETMNDKIADLSDLSQNLEGLSGTLDMKEYNESTTGYTFKKSNRKLEKNEKTS